MLRYICSFLQQTHMIRVIEILSSNYKCPLETNGGQECSQYKLQFQMEQLDKEQKQYYVRTKEITYTYNSVYDFMSSF